MQLTRSLLTTAAALATFAVTLRAEVFPVVRDTGGSKVPPAITKAAGIAKSLPVSSTKIAYLAFDVGSSGIVASNVNAARLTVYFPAVTKNGTISVHNIGSSFAETFLTPTIPTPALDAPLGAFAITTADARQFAVIDVTAQVTAWLVNPALAHGIAFTGDATLICAISSKEGASLGHPPVLEIDVAVGSSALADRSVTTFKLADVSVTTPKIALNAVTTLKLADNAVTAAKLDPSIGVWSASGGNVSRASGNVGIGNDTPLAKLDVTGDANITGPLQVQDPGANTGRIHVGGSEGGAPKLIVFGDADFVHVGENGADDTLELKGTTIAMVAAGNQVPRVGIGTTNPVAPLQVVGDIRLGPTGQYFAPAGGENLRIIRGTVTVTSSTPTGSVIPTAGTGFSVDALSDTAINSRKYTRVTFPAGTFSGPPTVTMSWVAFAPPSVVSGVLSGISGRDHTTAESGNNLSPSSSGFTVWAFGGGGEPVYHRWSFHFIAIGPR